MTRLWKYWVLGSAPSSCNGRQRSHQAPGSWRGDRRRDLTCGPGPAQPSTGTKAELICSQLPGIQTWALQGLATSAAPSVVCRSAPFAAAATLWNFEACNHSLMTASTSEKKGALPARKWESLATAEGFRALPKFSCIQLWHAAVADYSAVQLLPLQGRAEGSFTEQVIGNISRYCYLLFS